MSILSRCLVCALLTLAIPSCAGSHLATAEVEGTVSCRQKPVSNVQVQFVPDALQGTAGPRSTAITDERGYFYLEFDDGEPGAVVGQHRIVIIETPQETRGDKVNEHGSRQGPRKNMTPARLIDEQYSKVATSPLTREVVPGSQTINLELP
jgi:hypothetical protein